MGLTSGEGELDLLVDDLHGDEVVLLVEPSVVEQQSVPLSSGKPADTHTVSQLTNPANRLTG